jgi:hypothetical protein
VEIPSVEGPRVLEAVLRPAKAEGITVNRVPQGSGAMLLSASELRDMAQAGLDAGVEVCLFVGPIRAAGDMPGAGLGRVSCRRPRAATTTSPRPGSRTN